jgi:hypothetical protein
VDNGTSQTALRRQRHRKRVTPEHLGINVHCLDDFDPAGIPVRQAAGMAMP